MKILHVSYGDFEGAGGTSIAVNRLHNGLLEAGCSSKIACRIKSIQTDESIAIKRSASEFFLKKIFTPMGLNGLEGIGAFRLRHFPVFREADVMHLHTLHSGYFNYLALPRLTADKPAIWTHHDIWAYTGHCTFSYDCNRWKTGCGKCPYPKHYPAIKRDATALEWRLKKWAYQRSRFHLVVASTWLLDQMRESILSSFPIYRIPWGVDTEIYKPLDKERCRAVLGVPMDKKVVMFSAPNLQLHNKGGDLLHKALKSLPESLKKETILLTMGNKTRDFFTDLELPSVHVGYVSNDRFKAVVYSAADLFVLPTRAETFSLVALESLACGVPIVSFAIGPIPELVQNGRTGYLAEPENAEDLSQGIVSLLENDPLRESLKSQCRSMVLKDYTMELLIKRYLDLYAKVLGKTPVTQ